MRVETGYEMEGSSSDCGVLWLGSPNCNEFVVDAREECEMELVGGKALNISKLARKGFPTPEGFVITTKAYDHFLEFNGISTEDENIAERIREGLMPPVLSQVIKDAFKEYLQNSPCAVRSSSPFEDLKSASFAGQYVSFLNIVDEDTLLDAVKECWASLWSRSASEYRKRMGIDSNSIRMAVLVQEIIPAEVSGVLFTEDRLIIEAVLGLGDLLVGGKVTPDHFVAERKRFSVVKSEISHKTIMSRLNSSGGTRISQIPEDLRDRPVLEDHLLRKLCILGEKVENLFHCPQDIEWALQNGEFFLLQARPITVKQSPKVLSRANVAETQPGYVTYLSRSPENKPDFLTLGIRPFLECFDINDIPENMNLAEYVYGHMYLNMSTAYEVVGKIPGFSPEMLDQSVGNVIQEKTPTTKLEFYGIVKLLPKALKVVRLFLSVPARAELVIPHSLELIEDIRHRNLDEMKLEELDRLVWEMYERTLDVIGVQECSLLAILAMSDIFHKVLKRMGEESTESLLTIGLEGMSSRQLGVDIWDLAQYVVKFPRVASVICLQREDALEELNKLEEGRSFLKRFGEFMEKHGDRCSQEIELSVPRWEENPGFVISMIANYLDSKFSDPEAAIEKQKRIRSEATEQILKKLSKNPFEKILFKKILEKIQEYIVMREDLKTTWVKGVSAMRILYLNMAGKLVEKGILEKKDDIFYLRMTEVSEIITGNLKGEQVASFVKVRKKEKEECEHLDVPLQIVGEPPPIEELKKTVESRDTLKGMGVSHGVVTGKARVVLDPTECSDFSEGEILVAQVTDPGWTPLFVIAAGLVTDLGGMLSHGVIIAREYGIPAVVGVKDATKIIKTGQSITVDGSNGMVHINE
jgi:phosphoenolpyruvate synthase/pyruvate phosphate dikinase